MSFFKKFRNNKWITLTETFVGIIIIWIISSSILQILQTWKNIRYDNKANQDIFMIHENIINYLDIKNENFKSNISKWVYNFNIQSRNKFLSLFPSNTLNSWINDKDCYSIIWNNWNFTFSKTNFDWEWFISTNSNESLDIYWNNLTDSEYWYSYPTTLCISNWYDINNDVWTNKLINWWPVLLTIFSNYMIGWEVKNIHNEKKYYFEEK